MNRKIYYHPGFMARLLCIGLLCSVMLLNPLTTYASSGITAQQRNINVTVTVLEEDGKTLVAGALVLLESNTNKATTTNGDGIARLNEIPTNGTLIVKYLGFVTQKVSINSNEEITVKMITDAVSISEVVVTGYGGTQQRAKMTNSIAKVTSETFSVGMFSNPAQALAGAVSGLRVIQNSGNPGASPTVILRGGTSLSGGGSPLVVVDGQPRGTSMSDINPEDIESMEVMKDAGATAIYGARANSGVILITTKQGKSGKADITLKVKTGLNFMVTPYEFMNARDYLYYQRLAYQRASQIYQDSNGVWKGSTNMSSLSNATPYGTGNKYWSDDAKTTPLDGNKSSSAVWSTMKYSDDLAFLLNEGWQTMTDPVYGDKLIFKDYNLADYNIISPTVSQDYNLSMSGGTDRSTYYASLGYNHQEGAPVSNFYQRINATYNGSYKITDWLTSYTSGQFTEAKWNGMPPTQTDESNYFSRTLSLPRTFRGTNAAGEMLLGPNAGDGNQLYNIDKFIRDNVSDKFTFNQSFGINFTKDLDLKLSGIWYFSESQGYSFNKDYMTGPGNYNTARNSSASFGRTLNQTYNAILNYKKQVKDHNISVMLGSEFLDSRYRGFSASGSGAPTDDFADLEYTSTDALKRSIDSGTSRSRTLSFFARANYDFKNRYLLSVVSRYDAFSIIDEKNRWGFFPGVSAGWIVSEEEFMSPITKTLSYAKIRTSLGFNGNVEGISTYEVQGRYSSIKYAGNTGYTFSSIPNPYLMWERSRTFEVGVDLGFLANRFTVNMTYYNRLNKDKFADVLLPTSSGISSIRTNDGELQNLGFEFDVNAIIVNNKDWRWSASVNGGYNSTKITKLTDNGLERNRQGAFEIYTGNGDEKIWVGGRQQGQEIGHMFMFIAEGLYRDASEIPGNLIDKSTGNNGANNKTLYGPDAWAKLTDAQKAGAMPIQAGDVRWKDVNGDGIIDNYDRVHVGNSIPRWTGGLSTSVSWKGLSLYAMFDYALGFMTYNSRTPWLMGDMQGTYNSIVETKQTWSPENPDGKYPIYIWADQLNKRNYARESSMFLSKGDYIGLKEVALTYTLPKNWVNVIKMQRVDLSVTGQNLGYLSEDPHFFNPGVSSNGGYPLPRTLIFGLSITF